MSEGQAGCEHSLRSQEDWHLAAISSTMLFSVNELKRTISPNSLQTRYKLGAQQSFHHFRKLRSKLEPSVVVRIRDRTTFEQRENPMLAPCLRPTPVLKEKPRN